jgi:GxxExxY protein
MFYKEECYKLVGIAMDVHRELGSGFAEIIYKDALEFEFNQRFIPYEREKMYDVNYKGVILPHNFYADLVVYDSIILEIKGVKKIDEKHIGQTLNYLKASGLSLGLVINFGAPSLEYRRVIL